MTRSAQIIINQGDACFKRQVRLLKPDDFSRVFKKPVRSSDRYLTVLAVARDPGASGENSFPLAPRLGLAISKKNTKRAVDRNRLKRIIRESFRQNLQTLPMIDLVIMAKPMAKNAENQQIFRSLQQHWNKLLKEFQHQKFQQQAN